MHKKGDSAEPLIINWNWAEVPQEVINAINQFMESSDFDDEDFAGGPSSPEGYIEPYFYHWLLNDYGIKYTLGNYAIFIEAALRIIDIVMQDPQALDHRNKPRRIIGIFDPNVQRPHCFDPRVYEELKFLYMQRNVTDC